MKSCRVGIFDGIHGGTGGAQLVTAYLATAFSERCEVELIHDGTTGSLDSLRQTFGLPLAGVGERFLQRLPTFGRPLLRSVAGELTGPSSKLSEDYDLFIYSGFQVPPFCRARHGLVYCHFPFQQKLINEAKTLPNWRRHSPLGKFIRAGAHAPLWWYRLSGYYRVLANSAFTASWIKRRWGVHAEVLFPPVASTVIQRDKKDLIVTVGRFTGRIRHCKKQLEQVSAFRELLAANGSRWTLRMIGFCDSADGSAYVASVREAARELPIQIIEGASRAEVLESLAEAKVYWHTMGLDCSESENPEYAEHFGIATVEAMRAGCVPVVIAAGGQREIVVHGESGFLCSDLNDMTNATLSLAQNPERLVSMSTRARERSLAFSPRQFFRKLATITNDFFPGAISDALVKSESQMHPIMEYGPVDRLS
jgi:glycosyltransferase involved in cell wall biosynthesis